MLMYDHTGKRDLLRNQRRPKKTIDFPETNDRSTQRQSYLADPDEKRERNESRSEGSRTVASWGKKGRGAP